MNVVRSTLALGLLAAAFAATPGFAQTTSAPPNALQGFSQNRNMPVKIDAASLEVRDKSKTATFSGNVQVVQGDTMLRCKTLAVFYDQDGTGNALTPAKPGPAGQQRIRRLEARGGVVVTQKDQTATGDLGTFDMAANTVTLSGNVVVTHGQSILRGQRLTVNLTTGVSQVEGGRVQALFQPTESAPKIGRNGPATGSTDSSRNSDQPEAPKDTRRRPNNNASGLY
jgi:lipopolysaccharide export system protein LptA